MTRSYRPALAQDFFTPELRVYKGKERAHEQPPKECTQLCVALCKDWSCVVHHSLWLSRRARFLLKEFSLRRERSSRRPSTAAPHVSRWRFTRQRLPIHLAHSRHVSGTSSQPVSPHSDSSDVRPASPLETVQRVANLHNHSASGIGFDDALAAFHSLSTQDALNKLSADTITSFSEKLLSLAEKGCVKDDLELLHRRGQAIRDILMGLKSRPAGRALAVQAQNCLLIRAHALAGELEEANNLFDQIGTTIRKLNEDCGALTAYENTILSIQRHLGDHSMFGFIMQEWDRIAAYLTTDPHRWHHTTHKVVDIAFRRKLYHLLSEIADPVSIIRTMLQEQPADVLRASELLLMALCSHTLAHDAYDVYSMALKSGVRVMDKVALILVRTLVREEMFEEANSIFASVHTRFLHASLERYYLSTGLYLSAHQGKVAETEQFFERIGQLPGYVDDADTAHLMYAYATLGKADDTVEVFRQLFPTDPKVPRTPTSLHYSMIIYAYAQKGDFVAMNHWLETMSSAGFQPDIYVYSIILRSFALRGDMDSIAAALDQMRAAGVPPNRVSYTTVISLLANRRDPIGAETLYKRAIAEGIVPDRRMVSSVMNAHVEAGSWPGVIRAFDYLNSSPARNLRLTVEVYNTLLKAYVLIGAPFRIVSRLFNRLEKANVRPDSHTFALLIQSACDSGQMTIAAAIFQEMEKIAVHRQSTLHIDIYVLTILMAGYLRLNDKISAKRMYDEMQKRGIQPSAVTFGTILSAYGNEKTEDSLKIAEEFLESLMSVERSQRVWDVPSKGRRSALETVYGPLMAAYASQQRPEDVERIFQGFLDQGGEPSIGILAALLNAYRFTYNIDGVLQVWPQIFHLGLKFTNSDALFASLPDDPTRPRLNANVLCVPLSIYIDALSAAGMHTAIAEEWQKFQKHGFTFDSHNWNHLVVALVRAGEPERAFEVLERVILPYQRQTEHLQAPRNATPESPLTFLGDKPPPPGPSQEPPLHKPRSRAWRQRKLRQRSDVYEDLEAEREAREGGTDFVHPLYILHQISPLWNTWAPHVASLNVLLLVLSRLEEGLLIEPVVPGADPPEELPDPARRQAARELLGRIYRDYPDATQAVRWHELNEQRRLGTDYDSTFKWT
ncbi:hypothetical protein HGRIS_009317 [Hohenbuehelia grisea]|uniref:Pentatricopeptide repeat-containing protein n=1 Tax=Hohenbuehelia grisea TaxID=104357 RepID=A0ABR3J0X0_9AGAR